MKKLIAFILFLTVATITVIPILVLIMDATTDWKDSIIYNMYKEI